MMEFDCRGLAGTWFLFGVFLGVFMTMSCYCVAFSVKVSSRTSRVPVRFVILPFCLFTDYCRFPYFVKQVFLGFWLICLLFLATNCVVAWDFSFCFVFPVFRNSDVEGLKDEKGEDLPR
ncbi:hypothetical protein PanWU01x14_248810 [Parasponia andersonii]|uniref:Transmembrane protein n=1 Tax=Parasponia andersonii TaxID=3476 RepID=A0A2P5BDF8_PARAD|nr:hypothetical protein PanWU01x14_248810 [Parasponia andersonii]